MLAPVRAIVAALWSVRVGPCQLSTPALPTSTATAASHLPAELARLTNLPFATFDILPRLLAAGYCDTALRMALAAYDKQASPALFRSYWAGLAVAVAVAVRLAALVPFRAACVCGRLRDCACVGPAESCSILRMVSNLVVLPAVSIRVSVELALCWWKLLAALQTTLAAGWEHGAVRRRCGGCGDPAWHCAGRWAAGRGTGRRAAALVCLRPANCLSWRMNEDACAGSCLPAAQCLGSPAQPLSLADLTPAPAARPAPPLTTHARSCPPPQRGAAPAARWVDSGLSSHAAAGGHQGLAVRHVWPPRLAPDTGKPSLGRGAAILLQWVGKGGRWEWQSCVGG